MVTISDITAPNNASGYKYVRSASAGPNGGGKTELWKAEIHRPHWRSDYYRTPQEAAQAYCNYVNQKPVATPVTLKTAGHAYDIEKGERDPEVEAALGVLRDYKAQKAGRQGYVYLIGEKRLAEAEFVKIGYSLNPEKRIAELQCGNPRTLKLLGKVHGSPADEKAMHAKYIRDNILQEWFRYSPELYREFKPDRV